jgi:hypothetical protein
MKIIALATGTFALSGTDSLSEVAHVIIKNITIQASGGSFRFTGGPVTFRRTAAKKLRGKSGR